ncbi:MAG: hypothetical protein ACO3MW_15150, partial [Rhodospirillales bacterium]
MNTHDTHKAPKAKRPWSKTMIAGTVTASLIGSAAFGAFALARANDNAGVTTAAPSALLVSGQ